MPKGPSRARAHTPTDLTRGPFTLTCPGCGAAPGWRCFNLSHDSDGNSYITTRLKLPHPERRQAWRDRPR